MVLHFVRISVDRAFPCSTPRSGFDSRRSGSAAGLRAWAPDAVTGAADGALRLIWPPRQMLRAHDAASHRLGCGEDAGPCRPQRRAATCAPHREPRRAARQEAAGWRAASLHPRVVVTPRLCHGCAGRAAQVPPLPAPCLRHTARCRGTRAESQASAGGRGAYRAAGLGAVGWPRKSWRMTRCVARLEEQIL